MACQNSNGLPQNMTKILLYPKPHVVKVPDNWEQMTTEEKKEHCKYYFYDTKFEFDAYFDLTTTEMVKRLENLFGEAK